MLDTIKNLVSSPLTAKCRNTRSEALAECKSRWTEEHQARVRELQRKLGEAETQHAARVAEAERTERETTRRLRTALVSEFVEQATPFVRAFVTEPSRGVAAQLLELLKDSSAREEFETGLRNGGGGPVAFTVLAYAFVAEDLRDAPSIALVFGSDAHMMGDFGDAIAAMRHARTPPELQQALQALEVVIMSVARSCAHRPVEQRMIERFERVRLCDPEALAEFDRTPRAAPAA